MGRARPPQDEKDLSFGGFHSVELRISIDVDLLSVAVNIALVVVVTVCFYCRRALAVAKVPS